MKWNRQLIAAMLALCLVAGLLPMPAAAAELKVSYGEAKYSYIAIDSYSRTLSFHGGLVVAADRQGRYGLISADEAVALPFQYDGLTYLCGDLYAALSKGKQSVINSRGERLLGPVRGWITAENDTIQVYDSDSERAVYYTRDMKPAAATAFQGMATVPAALSAYDNVEYYHQDAHPEYDYYYVEQGGRNGILGRDFRSIVPLRAEGSVSAFLQYQGEPIFLIWDDSEESEAEEPMAGVVNYSGKVLAPAGSFWEVRNNGNRSLLVTTETQTGVMDYDGNWLLPLGSYRSVGFTSPEGRVSAVSFEGAMDGGALRNISSRLYQRGEEIRAFPGKWIETDAGNEYLTFTYDRKSYGLMDREGKVLIPEIYQEVSCLFDDLYRVRSGDRYGVLRATGAEVIPVDQEWVGGASGLLELHQGSAHSLLDRNGRTLASGAPGFFSLLNAWGSETGGVSISQLEYGVRYAREFCGYTGTVFALTSTDETGGLRIARTYYVDPAKGAILGELSCMASNITEDGLFAYGDIDEKGNMAYGFGRLAQDPPWGASVYGDYDGDGKANNKDVSRLLQAMARGSVDAAAHPAVDLNQDGRINNKDLALLLQGLAGRNIGVPVGKRKV